METIGKKFNKQLAQGQALKLDPMPKNFLLSLKKPNR